MSNKFADIFRVELKPKGVIPIFENMIPHTTKVIYKGKPISYVSFVLFLNAELQKLRKEEVTFMPEISFSTEHKGTYVWIRLTEDNVTYCVPKMRRSTWLNWFEIHYDLMSAMSDSITKNKKI